MTNTAGWTNSRFVQALTGRPVVFWIIVVAVFVVARLATWGYPFDSDHWIFYYVGHNWIVEGGQLYVTAWDHKPPMIFLFNGVMSLFLGDNIVLHRIWLTLFTVVDTWLFFLITKRVIPALLAGAASTRKPGFVARINPGTAVKLTLLLYVFLRNLSQFAANGNTTENYGLIFLLGMILAFLKFTDANKWGWLVLSGTFAGLLFWTKGNLILLGGVVGLLLLIHRWKRKGRLVGYVVLFVLPILIISAAWMAYFAAQGTFNDFIIASFSFSSKYASSAWAGKVSANFALILTTLVMLIPVLAYFVVYLRDIKAQWRNTSYQLVGLSFAIGLALIGAVGSFYSYYLLIIMPFMVIIVMYALLRIDSLAAWLKPTLVALLALTLVGNYAISMKMLLNNYTGSTAAEGKDYHQAANYVREHTSADQKVFAYDYGATFYELSGRSSASKFVSASHLLLDWRDNYGYGFDQTFINELEATQAPYIVMNDGTRNLYLANKPIADYIAEHYEATEKFGVIEVYKRTR